MLCYVRTVFENIDFKKDSLLSFDVNESTYQEFKSCGMSEIANAEMRHINGNKNELVNIKKEEIHKEG